MPAHKLPKIVWRGDIGKTGRLKIHGRLIREADRDIIELDARHGGRELLDTIIHEALHWQFPEMSEADVAKTAKRMTALFWRLNVRIVDQ